MARSGKLLIWLHIVAFPIPRTLTLRPLSEGEGTCRDARFPPSRGTTGWFAETTYVTNVATGEAVAQWAVVVGSGGVAADNGG